MSRASKAAALGALALCLALTTAPLRAVARGSILLDAETMALFRAYADPLIEVAGMQPHNIKIYLEGTNQVNALASPGQIILFSGLVLKTQTPEELQGIIAHEIAHIASGHIPTLVNQRQKASLLSSAATLIGIGAIIAGLAPLGALIIAGGSSTAYYSALGETRVAEASADQAALSYLDRAQISGRGLISFFRREFLPREQSQAAVYRVAPNPYRRTHPLSSDRLIFLEKRVQNARSYNNPTSPALQKAHEMISAKLYGFTQKPQATLERYSGNSAPARYARAVMFAYHLSDRQKSLALLNSLIREQPNNAYFHEMKGYVISRSGNTRKALASYQTAIRLAPYNLIMRLEIGNVLARSNEPLLIRQGITHLRLASQDKSIAPSTYRPMARAHGVLGEIGLAELATAEALLIQGDRTAALTRAKKALRKLPQSDRVHRLRAQDIISILDKSNKRQSQ